MEAVFSPVSDLSFVHMNEVRVKIAALKYGKKLLAFGWRPVVRLDLQSISTVDGLKAEIEMELERAGLKKADLEILMASTNSPRDLLYRGVRMLNEDFEETFGVRRKTIVLVDEYDKLFRDRDIDNYQQDTENDSSIVLEKKRTVEALFQIFGVGNQDSLDGISLLVLCGLARMVGQQALSEMNNIVDISQVTKYHGLCGISARELVKCANGRLDDLAKNNYNGKSFVTILKETFIPDWDGFRFGLDAKVGPLDPESFDGALFSPLDVWEIVRSLVENSNTPSSRWISTMKSEFEFTSFAERYTSSPERFFELCRNLQGGWVDTKDPGYNMNREDYLLLKENEHVRKVLFEVGLLSVKEISNQKALNQNLVRLGSPNWTVTRNAMRLLMDKTQHGITSEDLARTYVEDTVHGFGKVVASAAREVSTVCRGTGKDVLREYPFQDYLFAELLFRFPEGLNGFPPCYKLYKEVSVECSR